MKNHLTCGQVAHVCQCVLKGLVYLHKTGIIHRDLKAANILLTKDGIAKIADFGVSGQINAQMSKRNTIIGTPLWMSPEAIQGTLQQLAHVKRLPTGHQYLLLLNII